MDSVKIIKKQVWGKGFQFICFVIVLNVNIIKVSNHNLITKLTKKNIQRAHLPLSIPLVRSLGVKNWTTNVKKAIIFGTCALLTAWVEVLDSCKREREGGFRNSIILPTTFSQLDSLLKNSAANGV